MDYETLGRDVDTAARAWDASGAISIYREGVWTHEWTGGAADRESGEPITPESTYLFTCEGHFLMGICLGKLMDAGKVRLADPLSRYIPEYTHAPEITVAHLCLKQSGMPDFLGGQILPAEREKPAYQSLDAKGRSLFDRAMQAKYYPFDEALSRVQGMALESTPGTLPTDDLENKTETVFLREVIERAGGKRLPALLCGDVFAPLQIHAYRAEPDTRGYCVMNQTQWVQSPCEADERHTFAATLWDMKRLLEAVMEGKILSPRTLRALLKAPQWGQSALFDRWGGFLCARELGMGELGWHCNLLIDWERRTGFLYLTNSEETVRYTEEGASRLIRVLIDRVKAESVYPKNPRLLPFNERTLAATRLTIRADQREYMMTAQQAICRAYAYKQRLRILMEGETPVGLIAVSKNQKEKTHYIESVLIDEKFQRRGFGKILLTRTIVDLKKHGCTHLAIGVHRRNVAAQALYKSVGFTEKNVYEDFVRMEMALA